MSGDYPTPSAGDIYEHNGRIHNCTGKTKEHTTKDGRSVVLMEWIVPCMRCLTPTSAWFPNVPWGQGARKYCDECLPHAKREAMRAARRKKKPA